MSIKSLYQDINVQYHIVSQNYNAKSLPLYRERITTRLEKAYSRGDSGESRMLLSCSLRPRRRGSLSSRRREAKIDSAGLRIHRLR